MRSAIHWGATGLAAVVAPASEAQVPVPEGFSLWAPDCPARRDDEATAAIIARATSALDRPPAPLPRVHTEGTLPGQGIREASIAARRDLQLALDFAVAWRATRDRRFLVQAGRYLDAWVATYRLSLNPIDETWFDRLLLATDLVKADLTPAQRQAVAAFWRRMAEGYLTAMRSPRPNPHTNWQSHRVKLATLAAYQVGDKALIDQARVAFRAQVTANIRPDGSVFDFHERDALHYVVYDLDPLLTAALAAKLRGEDWYRWRSPTGSSLRTAVAWLTPYANGSRKHVEFVGSRVAFDRARAAAGQQGFAPHEWDPAAAAHTFMLAAELDLEQRPIALKLSERQGASAPDWLKACRGRAGQE